RPRRFFLSSRRRQTTSKRDWSSDVCSSDLGVVESRPLFRLQDPLGEGVNIYMHLDAVWLCGLQHFSQQVISRLVTSPLVEFGFRSEEHTSELQSRFELVCRLLLETERSGAS